MQKCGYTAILEQLNNIRLLNNAKIDIHVIFKS